MKRIILIILFCIISFSSFTQQNDFFIKLSEKEIASFNDGITLIRLLYNERDDNADFIENILWAAKKKLFQVSIPIKPDEVNPVLSRREFAYWICKVFNTKGGLVNTRKVTRFSAFKKSIELGIISKGRGALDSFTGQELLDTFSYLDYYVRYNNIKPRKGTLEMYDDNYQDLPEWRERLYKELDEQKRKEKELREEKRKKIKDRIKENLKEGKDDEKLIEKKIIEKKIEE